jgi:uracil phosphoribosyltransferase
MNPATTTTSTTTNNDNNKRVRIINDTQHDDNNNVVDVGIHSPAVIQLLTTIRDKTTPRIVYQEAFDRLATRLADEAFSRLHCIVAKTIETPTGVPFTGLTTPNHNSIVLISILRSGDILLEACRKLAPQCQVGKILIQRNEHHAEKLPVLYWKKLPLNLADKDIIVCDPMLGTGGTITCCVGELVKLGAVASRILFLNVISCPEGYVLCCSRLLMTTF